RIIYAMYKDRNTYDKQFKKCAQKNDRFTVSDESIGNKDLTYPVGLMSADEISLAGMKYVTVNSTNYLYTNQYYWSLSPALLSSGIARVWYVYSTGYLDRYRVNNTGGLRPVVSLASTTKITGGSGTSTNPYIVE
ncbi:MAG: hypothetical protein WCR93_02005, partial [Bacilli bacterium]